MRLVEERADAVAAAEVDDARPCGEDNACAIRKRHSWEGHGVWVETLLLYVVYYHAGSVEWIYKVALYKGGFVCL